VAESFLDQLAREDTAQIPKARVGSFLDQLAAEEAMPKATSKKSPALTDVDRPVDVDFRRSLGRAETGLQMLTGAAGTVVGGLTGISSLIAGADPNVAADRTKWWQEKLTYDPRTAEGRESSAALSELMEHPANPLSWVGRYGESMADAGERAGLPPGVLAAARTVPEAIAAIAGANPRAAISNLREAPTVARRGAERVLGIDEPPLAPIATDPLAGFGSDSASAAAASRINAATNISNELLEDLRAQVRKGPLDTAAVDRQIDADALPIRMRLMEGQASKDPEVWSREFNAKGKDPEVAARFNLQNQQLIDNLDEFRRQAAPQAVAHDPVQSGQNIVDAYKRMDEAATTEIDAAYKAARDANGGDLPMDGHGFVAAADAALKKNMKARYLPSEIAADLAEIRETGAMNFETFENMRTNLAAEARKAERSGDGNAAAAISLVRDALENVEPLGRAKEVKPLFDTARSLAKARFDKIKADPAYKAAVNDDVGVGESSPLADKFVQKYIVGAPRAHVERMIGNLASDDLAMETVRAAPFNYLKQKAGIDPYRNEGNFSQHGYNRALAELMPKLDVMVGEELAEGAQRLGRVAYDVKSEPAGSFPNRSNTFIASTAEAAKGLAERSANTLLGGNIVPVGSWAREKLDARAAAREQKERLRPAAGTLAKEKKP
jgi:hypothetical protein